MQITGNTFIVTGAAQVLAQRRRVLSANAVGELLSLI
jgi:hypothetical protein